MVKHYRILGSYTPQRYTKFCILLGLSRWLKNRGYSIKRRQGSPNCWGCIDIKDPEENASARSGYHRDSVFDQDSTVYWCSAKPTKIREDRNGRLGKRIGGDVKAYDVMLVEDWRCFHSRPDNVTLDDQRWFVALLIQEAK